MSKARAAPLSPGKKSHNKKLNPPPSLQCRNAKACAVGVDFGTSRTGYAYAFFNNPDEIISKQPGSQDAGKTHSSILLKTDGSFLAFGLKAREMYFDHAEQGLFFENYKMCLDGVLLNEPQATALNGQQLPLVHVIAEMLAFIRREAMEEINKSQVAKLKLEDVLWVVTVPAIWKDKSKGLMREAARRAGLIPSAESNNLQLVLEPEAACMTCESDGKQMKVGQSFMVLDCGGGTVDITTYRLKNKNPWSVEELAPPAGGPWGSIFVDEQFEQFVEDLVGPIVMKQFKPSAAWVDLMETWEKVKLGLTSTDSADDNRTVAINFAPLLDYLPRGATMPSIVQAYNENKSAQLQAHRSTTILVPLRIIKGFFFKVTGKVVTHVQELLNDTPVDYILLVGGFAESRILLGKVKEAFEQGGTTVLVPLRPSHAVVKGAVLFSLGRGMQVQSRIARFTYGVDYCEDYDPAQHPYQKCRKIDHCLRFGKRSRFIDDIFHPMVYKGAALPAGYQATWNFVPFQDDQAEVTCNIFVSAKSDAKFTDEEGVQSVGTVAIPMVRGQTGKLFLEFGSTEIIATIHNKETGARVRTAIDYHLM